MSSGPRRGQRREFSFQQMTEISFVKNFARPKLSQHIRTTFATLSHHVCNTCATLLQHDATQTRFVLSTSPAICFATLLQHFRNTFATLIKLSQHFHNTFATLQRLSQHVGKIFRNTLLNVATCCNTFVELAEASSRLHWHFGNTCDRSVRVTKKNATKFE